MTDTRQALAACPFCGEQPTDLEFTEGSTFRWLAWSCPGCGVGSETRKQTMGEGSKEEWCEQAKEDARKTWNTRAALSAQPAPAPEPSDEAECEHATIRYMLDATKTEPSAQGEPVAPLLFVAMDDDKRAHLTWCADEAAVRDAVKGAMFFLHDGEELSPDHAEQLDGSVDELLDSGALTFEGDPPLYLYRVASAPSTPPPAVAEAAPLTASRIHEATPKYTDPRQKAAFEDGARFAERAHGIAPKAAQP